MLREAEGPFTQGLGALQLQLPHQPHTMFGTNSLLNPLEVPGMGWGLANAP